MRRVFVSVCVVGALALAPWVSGRGARSGAKAAVPGVDEVRLSAVTLVVNGYEETVTVDATLDQLSDFFADPSNLMFPGVTMEPLKPAQNETTPGLGAVMDATMEWNKLKFPARYIVVKRDPQNIWFVRDNPLAFGSMVWKLTPAADGTRVTLRWEYAIPQDKLDLLAGELVVMFVPIEQWNSNYDLMLANLQARYNPSLDPKELVKNGLRGEAYQTLYQIQQAEVSIKASPKKVEQWLDHPSNHYWGLAPDENDCLYRAPSAERAIYCAEKVKYAGQELPLDAFYMLSNYHGQDVRNVYTMVMDMPGVMQINLDRELAGTRLRLSWGIETPDPRQAASLDQTLFIATLPSRVQAAARSIRDGVEGRR